MQKRLVTILGATGSIGSSTLKVIDRYPEQYQVYALTADKNIEAIYSLALQYHPRFVVMADEEKAEQLRGRLEGRSASTILAGAAALVEVAAASVVDIVVAAIVGSAGLLPTMAAAEAGKQILFANKEALVMAGAQFMKVAKASGAILLPIDSEHNAIFQCLPHQLTAGGTIEEPLEHYGVKQILLTASGGPFLARHPSELTSVTPEEACQHPNWKMGRKISVDSATMMNKGLELIEACWLFNVPAEQVEVVIHPQSVIHSMVSYCDGSVLAQLGTPDMCTPIAYGLGWPERIDAGVKPLDLFEISQLTFSKPNDEQFPCLALARAAAEEGGAAPIVLNAANEVAVSAFLERRVTFMQIAELVKQTLACLKHEQSARLTSGSIEAILQVDAIARSTALELLDHYSAAYSGFSQ